MQAAPPEEQDELLDELWERVLFDGGCLFSTREVLFGFWNVGHESQLSVCRLALAPDQPLEKRFLVSDPELSTFKALTVDQFRHLALQKEAQICFTDIPGIERATVFRALWA
jgi:hypothetical protein